MKQQLWNFLCLVSDGYWLRFDVDLSTYPDSFTFHGFYFFQLSTWDLNQAPPPWRHCPEFDFDQF